MESFIDKYNWEGINHPSGVADWKSLDDIKMIEKHIPLKFQNTNQLYRNIF